MKSYTPQQIQQALNQDPLHDAEQIVGRSYKEDKSVAFLGMVLQMRKSEALNRMLTSGDDTTFSMSVGGYAAVIERIGFEEVLRQPFVGRYGEECFYVYYRQPGLLLSWDTFQGKTRNAANIYYNWIPSDWDCRHGLTSSGHLAICDEATSTEYDRLRNIVWKMERAGTPSEDAERAFCCFRQEASDAGKIVWAGSHDAREALRHIIQQLESHGRFVEPWKADPRPWLCHHGDTDQEGCCCGATISERLGMLPECVKELVAVSVDARSQLT